MARQPTKGGVTSRVARELARGTFVLALAACSPSSSVAPPRGDPLVTGPIESITARATATGLLVRAAPGSREMCGISAVANASTRFLRRSPDGVLAAARLADLAVGDTVEVFVDGPVAESCPVQGGANVIVLIGKAS